MPDYKKKLVIEPGEKVKLKKFDPSDHGKHTREEDAQPETDEYLAKMARLQPLMFAEKKHSLLIVLQGLDTAGKDGVVKHVLTGMNPQGCTVAGFKEPTPEELAHDFLWRVHPHAPRKGNIAIFNRSHYEAVLVERVHKLAPKEILAGRYDHINAFERLISEENGTKILKFFLHISKEEQLERFKDRLDDPTRHWKIGKSDYEERKLWDDYMDSYEKLLEKTSTEPAPWFVIPSNHKWFRNLAISQIVVSTLEEMQIDVPKPTVDIAEMRKQYKLAKAKSK